jgi:hypothetical protein
MAPTVAGKQAERIDGTIKIDASAGEVSFDAIVKGGTNADKTMFTKYSDLRGEVLLFQRLLHCLRKQEAKRRTTRAGHVFIVRQQTALDKPSDSAMVNAATSHNQEEKMQFIKYKPQPDAPGYNPAASYRVCYSNGSGSSRSHACRHPCTNTGKHLVGLMQKIEILYDMLHRQNYPRKKEVHGLYLRVCPIGKVHVDIQFLSTSDCERTHN